MEEKQELSVQELSNRTGRTIQSIYKRIRNPNDLLQGFLKRDSNGNVVEPVRIYENAIDIIYNKGKTTTNLNPKPQLSSAEETKEKKEEQNAYSKAIEVLQEQLNLLQEELKVERADKEKKDKLIFELNERLAESQRMIDQQQKLSLADKQQILLLEEKTKPVHKRLFDIFKRKPAESAK